MAQRRSPHQWDITLDGNKYKIVKGAEDAGYRHGWQHISVNEQERFSLFERGHMQSRADLRGFQQTDWSGGHTWFKPMLPNEGGNTYAYSSLFDAYTKPGNLVPLNDITQATQSEGIQGGHLLVAEDGSIHVTSSTPTAGTGPYEIWTWTAASDDFTQLFDGGTAIEGPDSFDRTTIHSMLLTGSIDFGYVLANGDVGSSALGQISYFDPNGSPNVSNYISADGTLTYSFDLAPGSRLMYFDGELMLYDGEKVIFFSDPSPVTTTVTDDAMQKDMLYYAGLWETSPGGGMIVDPSSINLSVATDRGIFYVKNVRQSSGQPQARIFRVEVTDSGVYLREPIGSLPEGVIALNVAWHLDSLLIIGTPDWGLLQSNNRAGKYFRSQLYHYTQGSVGAAGSFDGNHAPTESPLYFVKADGTSIWIGSDQRMWVYDTLNGGLHQLFDYPTAFTSGIVSGTEALNSSSEHIHLMVGEDVFITQKKPMYDNPKTGSWAAKSYTLESNYFNFGVEHEQKQLVYVSALFEAGSANETFYVDIQNDDDGAWTNVASWTADNGGAFVETDITASNITGNRFQYRVRLEVSSGTNKPEFRGIGFKALSGKTVEVWDLTLDGTEIVNVENEKQDPNVVYNNLKTTAEKEVFVSLTDHYGRSDTDAASAVDVRVDQVLAEKSDVHEAVWRVRLTKVDL